MKNHFTQAEIDAALHFRQQLINGQIAPELKSAYIAGEICMWHEIHTGGSPARKELIAQAIKDCDKSEEWYRQEIESEENSPNPDLKRIEGLKINRVANLHREAELLSE